MTYRLFAALVCIALAHIVNAESWDYIRTSGEYFYGASTASTENEADKAAMADLIGQIATHVSSDFIQIDDMNTRNGNVDHKSRVLNCVKTYSQATLSNTEKWVEGSAPKITVRRWLKKSELARIFENRIAKAQNMIKIADECLKAHKIDMALQYYYWAYSLIRSVQFPDEVKDAQGKTIVDWLPIKIDAILSDIKVQCTGKDGDFIDLSFTYQGEPVSSLEFSYSDGRAICQGLAKDGVGLIEMIPDYETDTYHIDIEYEYKSQARGDSEMQSVLRVVTPKVFPKASITVSNKDINPPKRESSTKSNLLTTDNIAQKALLAEPNNEHDLRKIIANITQAISSRQYSEIAAHFTIDGLQQFNRLTNYGSARIVDDTNLKFHKSLNGGTVVRGLKMSFAFNGRRKKTFVEDISLTFSPDNKIENVAFGLGQIAEDGIFNKNVKWPNEVSEIIVSFMENYKTAYSLERLDYIENIFHDEAIIIVGNVTKRGTTAPFDIENQSISEQGKDVITYNRYTKDQYIANLRKCFNRNDFINLKFTNHEIQWLEKFNNETIFAINIRQQYDSSTYSDNGYLFLLVDMTDRKKPMIMVRTWQPNEVAIDKLYNAGDFFND